MAAQHARWIGSAHGFDDDPARGSGTSSGALFDVVASELALQLGVGGTFAPLERLRLAVDDDGLTSEGATGDDVDVALEFRSGDGGELADVIASRLVSEHAI